ncbi:cupredoxin domain-containing protein [Bordetella petrii]|uniref:cupredoxin domain-containing protein n=1 Tax=Bordetella petrii TaxID=94624 RepID=UPI001E491667|nr:cupredoxin family protein [Bordetella petrii]MCD0503946.1 cupredoxin family protein [Bordetella petrii]
MSKTMKALRPCAAVAALLATFSTLAAGGHTGGHGNAAAAAVGKPGKPSQVTRTIEIGMTDDMRFTPESIDVKAGETVSFNVTNSGVIRHEMVLGTPADLGSHYQMMMNDPGMRHEEPNSVSLEAGKSGQIIWTFDTAGRVAFACLEPGHYPAGMKGTITVQ